MTLTLLVLEICATQTLGHTEKGSRSAQSSWGIEMFVEENCEIAFSITAYNIIGHK